MIDVVAARHSIESMVELCRSGKIKSSAEQVAYLRGVVDALNSLNLKAYQHPANTEPHTVANFDALGSSVTEIAAALTAARTNDQALVIDEVGLDMQTATGEFAASAIAASTQLTNELKSERTKAALAIKRAEGVRIGRPSSTPAEVVARIVSDRKRGLSLARIAESLNADGISTPRGGSEWRGSSVKSILLGQNAAQIVGYDN